MQKVFIAWKTNSKDNLAQEHKQKVRIEQDDYDRKVKEVRDAHTENQHRIEKKMHELKVQWAKEHPAEEVKVVEWAK